MFKYIFATQYCVQFLKERKMIKYFLFFCVNLSDFVTTRILSLQKRVKILNEEKLSNKIVQPVFLYVLVAFPQVYKENLSFSLFICFRDFHDDDTEKFVRG